MILTGVPVPGQVCAQQRPALPAAGSRIGISPAYTPATLAGVNIDPRRPFDFDFIIHPGDSGLNGEELRGESLKLIKYFMAALTLDEEQLWVNLSPYEAERVIPERFGHTEMGRDLLAQDYLLKQLTASLMYPEDELGDRFWQRVNRLAYEKFGTAEIPLNTFNKIWIVPD
ncbi:MAG: hypothetical protein KC897_12940, partial [Candidatus Omnitrophica bacterium]|nr:hypothetical protein [Candidatus Omnitrophota bacterium]